MNREHYVAGQTPDWSRRAQAFRPLTETRDADGRVSAGLYYRAPDRDEPDLADDDVELPGLPWFSEYARGWLHAGTFYALASSVLILAFRWLGGA